LIALFLKIAEKQDYYFNLAYFFKNLADRFFSDLYTGYELFYFS